MLVNVDHKYPLYCHQPDNGQLFLKLDSRYISIGSSNFTYALDIFLKSFIVLNVKIPPEAEIVYKFFEMIYHVNTKSLPALIELETQILNFVVKRA